MFARADAYERFMGRWSRRLAADLVRFADVGDDDAVLDVGCGTGSLSFAVLDATKTARVTGIDPSDGFVAYAAHVRADERASFRTGDARALPFDDATFDRTMSLLVLNFVPEPARAVEEWRRVTKPGGVVSAAVWDYGEGMQMLRAFWDEATKLEPAIAALDEAHMPLCKRGDLGALWRQVGFANVIEQALTVDLELRSFDDYWQPFLLGQGPGGAYAASLPDDRRDELAARLRARLLGGAPDGAFRVEARAWAVRGTVPA